MELSYERDSRWRPHLSWNFSSCSLQQQMEEQAAQRELAWQRLTERLGTTLIADGGGYKTFVQTDHKPASPSTFVGGSLTSKYNNTNLLNNNHHVHLECPEEEEEAPAARRTGGYQQGSQAYQIEQNYKEKYCTSSTPIVECSYQHQAYNNHFQNKSLHCYYYTNIPEDEMDHYEHYKKAKRRCMAVSTVLISLTMLLFTIVILMALGIVHR